MLGRAVLTVILTILVVFLVVNGYFLMRAKDKSDKDGDGENGHI